MRTTPREAKQPPGDRPLHRRSRIGRLFSAATASLLIACGSGAGSSDRTLDTVVETIGDTTVVRTLAGSVWVEEATLVPEITIGMLDGPEEYLFGRIGSVAVNDDGTVYILDRLEQHVRVFDSLGVYLETLGRRGEGPGEFTSAEAIAALPGGRIARGQNPGRKSSKVLQGRTICVSCRCTEPCWTGPREREERSRMAGTTSPRRAFE
ncbi:MAG: 6-bladed beta-propeller [Gammaproteobacteria bacterium]|nr:6-bladed beta-propeller [Gammaproteobacteria bacterium]MYC53016.1 6-bladed beta-propeller [Gammaproteobacteria bacterium]